MSQAPAVDVPAVLPQSTPAAAPAATASADAFDGWLLRAPGSLHVAYFYADFHAPSLAGGQLDGVVNKLAELHSGVRFAKVRRRRAAAENPARRSGPHTRCPMCPPAPRPLQVDAEALADVADQFDVSVVPTFVLVKVRDPAARVPPTLMRDATDRTLAPLSDPAPPP